MKKKVRLRFGAVIAALGLGVSAQAGFVNGGFETGNFTGWTLEHGINYGGAISFSAGSAGHAYIVGAGHNDPYTPFDAPFDGNYMARLNEDNPNADATRLSQTGTMGVGETDLYIAWGAALEDPGHARNQQPYFGIVVKVNGAVVANENHNASDGTAGGWTAGGTGPNGSPLYYDSDVFHISGLNVGDQVYVEMTAVDCSPTGHSGWAYLDGIGTAPPTPPPGASVPDGGATALLLAPALLGLVALRRKH
jgi:hypothetical protein